MKLKDTVENFSAANDVIDRTNGLMKMFLILDEKKPLFGLTKDEDLEFHRVAVQVFEKIETTSKYAIAIVVAIMTRDATDEALADALVRLAVKSLYRAAKALQELFDFVGFSVKIEL